KAKFMVILVSLNLSMFLVSLDNTILSSAIPKITDRFLDHTCPEMEGTTQRAPETYLSISSL
ncbi:hypothetical protein BJX68DRAFT_232723, partial [Aspergillus pseudodeflectus]